MNERQFPPLSTSIKSLLKDGTDREFRRLIYSLIAFADMIVRHRNMYGAYIGVTGLQYTMMSIIAGTPNVTVGHVARTMDVSSQFVTGEIGKLARKNIVTKNPNESDRRSIYLGLTLKGRTLLRKLGPVRQESNNLMYRSLTGDRAKTLQEIIDALSADAKIALHELGAMQRRGYKALANSSEHGARDMASSSARIRVVAKRG
jgi:DNA-binding MarR family transcriptional regulator